MKNKTYKSLEALGVTMQAIGVINIWQYWKYK